MECEVSIQHLDANCIAQICYYLPIKAQLNLRATSRYLREIIAIRDRNSMHEMIHMLRESIAYFASLERSEDRETCCVSPERTEVREAPSASLGQSEDHETCCVSPERNEIHEMLRTFDINRFESLAPNCSRKWASPIWSDFMRGVLKICRYFLDGAMIDAPAAIDTFHRILRCVRAIIDRCNELYPTRICGSPPSYYLVHERDMNIIREIKTFSCWGYMVPHKIVYEQYYCLFTEASSGDRLVREALKIKGQYIFNLAQFYAQWSDGMAQSFMRGDYYNVSPNYVTRERPEVRETPRVSIEPTMQKEEIDRQSKCMCDFMTYDNDARNLLNGMARFEGGTISTIEVFREALRKYMKIAYSEHHRLNALCRKWYILARILGSFAPDIMFHPYNIRMLHGVTRLCDINPPAIVLIFKLMANSGEPIVARNVREYCVDSLREKNIEKLRAICIPLMSSVCPRELFASPFLEVMNSMSLGQLARALRKHIAYEAPNSGIAFDSSKDSYWSARLYDYLIARDWPRNNLPANCGIIIVSMCAQEMPRKSKYARKYYHDQPNGAHWYFSRNNWHMFARTISAILRNFDYSCEDVILRMNICSREWALKGQNRRREHFASMKRWIDFDIDEHPVNYARHRFRKMLANFDHSHH